MEECLLELMYEIPDKHDVAEIVINDKVINEGKKPSFMKTKDNHITKKAV